MALSLQVEQIPNSYNIQIVATSAYPELGIKITIYDDVTFNTILELNNSFDPGVYKSGDIYIFEAGQPYSDLTIIAEVDVSPDISAPWEEDAILDNFVIYEHEIEVEWEFDNGSPSAETILEVGTEYLYFPSYLLLNNHACPLTGGYAPSITYVLSKLVNGVWVDDDPVTNSLASWNDEIPNSTGLSLPFVPDGSPIKIVTTLRNCNHEVTHSTLDGPGLFTVNGSETTHSESQDPGSYTVRFAFEFLDPFYGDLIVTPENNARCDVYIYKNNEIIHIYEDLLPGQFYAYTFSEATSENADYKVIYKSINPDFDNLEQNLEVPLVVNEYKPTFDLPTISCVKINENANIFLQNLNFNCFNADESFHMDISPLDPSPDFTSIPNIRYTLYYFNPNTYVWELQAGPDDTPGLYEDALMYADANYTETDLFVSEYIRTKYYYGSLFTDKGLWTPNKLTMVKLVVAVTNYSTTVTKEVVFPICGTWKVRKLSCGKYRIYNYKNNTITYSVYDNITTPPTLIKTDNIGPFVYAELDLKEDGVYKIQADGITQFIFNFCTLEECILNLQKQILLDECFCDNCKRNKDLYQKAMRMLPLYETWKKLLDKDGVYDIQYKTTDINGELARIYDAQELYLELSKLCESCGDIQKKCGC